MSGGDDENKIHRRITWLNANTFSGRHIDKEAIAAVKSLGAQRGLQLLKDTEEKADHIANPSGYLKAAVAREAPQAASTGDGKVQRRATWLNSHVFQDRRIDAEAIAAVQNLSASRAMELFKDLEEKQDQVQNPSGYLKAAVKREGYGYGEAPVVDEKIHRRATWLNNNVFRDRPIDDEAIIAMSSLGPQRAMELFKEIEEKDQEIRSPSGYLKTAARSERGGARAGGHGAGDDKVHKRATWLNANVFPDRPIDAEAIAALSAVGSARAMELCKDVEEKAQQVKNPSGYLKAAVARDGPSQNGYGKVTGAVDEEAKIQKRITWLNANVFPDRIIDIEATGAMFGFGIARAFELLKEVEAKADGLRNPSGYLKTAALREGLAPPGGQVQVNLTGPPNQEKVWKRAAWLNDKIFRDRPIDEEAIAAMCHLSTGRAMELFKDVEEKGAQLRSPSGYLKTAVSRESSGPTRPAPAPPPAQQGGGKAPDKLHRRMTWLNANVFGYAPLDREALEAAASIRLERALEILKDLEGKGSSVQNPSGYVKAAIKREYGGAQKRPAAAQLGPPAKRRG